MFLKEFALTLKSPFKKQMGCGVSRMRGWAQGHWKRTDAVMVESTEWGPVQGTARNMLLLHRSIYLRIFNYEKYWDRVFFIIPPCLRQPSLTWTSTASMPAPQQKSRSTSSMRMTTSQSFTSVESQSARRRLTSLDRSWSTQWGLLTSTWPSKIPTRWEKTTFCHPQDEGFFPLIISDNLWVSLMIKPLHWDFTDFHHWAELGGRRQGRVLRGT